jgi:hypothetical protein
MKLRSQALETKLQILNAAVKMLYSNPSQIFLLFKYILDLCKYDQNYDLRDRTLLLSVSASEYCFDISALSGARMFRKLLIRDDGQCRLDTPYASIAAAIEQGQAQYSALEQQMLASFVAQKPSPQMISPFKGLCSFMLHQSCQFLGSQSLFG